ncbi:major facilitator superfamily domain-containing protein 10 isoform X1 [Ictidomys tridecemlineatus]
MLARLPHPGGPARNRTKPLVLSRCAMRKNAQSHPRTLAAARWGRSVLPPEGAGPGRCPASVSARPSASVVGAAGPVRHGVGSGLQLHPAPAHPPAARARTPRGGRALPGPAAGPLGLYAAVAPATRAAGEPRPRARPALRLVAARRGLVRRGHRGAGGGALPQRAVWRSDRLGLLLPAVPLRAAHGGRLRLPGAAPSDAAVPVWAASRSFAAFLASRVIGGISKGNVSLSTAIVADLGSPPARSQGMAVIGVAFSLAFTLGPMLGASLSVEMAPWLSLFFAVSNLLFIFCFLPETLPPEKRVSWRLGPMECPLSLCHCLVPREQCCPLWCLGACSAGAVLFLKLVGLSNSPQAPSVALGFRAAADLLSPVALLRFAAVARGQDPPTRDKLGSLRGLGLVYFLYLFLFSGLEYTLSFLAHQHFQFSSLQQGKMFFFIGLTMATIQGTYARRISPGREVAAVKRALLLLVPAFLLIGWGHSLPVLGLGLLFYSFAAAVVVPCLSSMVASYGSPGQKGTVMGTLRSLGALARAVGPMVAASVYWLAGAQVCFTVCSGLFLFPFLLLLKLRHPAPVLKAE